VGIIEKRDEFSVYSETEVWIEKEELE